MWLQCRIDVKCQHPVLPAVLRLSIPALAIIVNPTPTVSTILSDLDYCNNATTTAIGLAGTPSGVKFDISGGSSIGLADVTGVSSIPSFTATNSGTTPITATITVTPQANNCTGTSATSKTFKITVNPTPTVSTTLSDLNYCNNATTAAIGLAGTPSGVKFDISGGSSIGLSDVTGVSSIPSFTATNSGTTPITATITVTPQANNCTGTSATSKTFKITVNPTPTVSTTLSDLNYCNNATTAAIGLAGTPSGVKFDISGGSSIGLSDVTGVSSIPSFTATNSGTTPITATITVTPQANNCTGTSATSKTFKITVNPTPTVSTTLSDLNYCNNATTTAIGLAGTPSGVKFDISGGSSIGLSDVTGVSSIPSFTATNSGTTPITATITVTPQANNCTGTSATSKTFKITVNPTPTVSTTLSDLNYCNNATTTAIGLAGTPSGVKFDISGGSTIGLSDVTGVSSIPSFTATNSGTTPITATITVTPQANNCTGSSASSKTFRITVNPTLVPAVTITSSSLKICTTSPNGSTPVTFSILSSSNLGSSPTYQWKLNNANVGQQTGSTYSANGLADGSQISLFVTPSVACSVSTFVTSNIITLTGVTPPGKPSTPTSISSKSICPVANVDLKVTADPNVTDYIWNLPTGWSVASGGTTNSVTATVGAMAGNGNNIPVNVQAKNACGVSTASGDIQFNVNKFTAVDAGQDQSVCAGGTITLGATLGGNANSATWSIVSPQNSGDFSNVNSLTSTFTPTISSGTITLMSTTNKPNGSSCNSTPGTDKLLSH